jgi:hypothetical protein
MDIRRKKVDEDWKTQIDKEKVKEEKEIQDAEHVNAAPALQHIVSIFATQALLNLGEMANPLTGQAGVDLVNAKFSIDTMEFLKEKTKGNLSGDEEKYLDTVLSELKMLYVRHAGTMSGV